MIKSELIEEVSQKTGQDPKEIRTTLESAFEIMFSELDKPEGKVIIRNFGTFENKERAGKIGHDFQSGGSIEIPPKRKVTFKPTAKFQQ